MDVIRIRQIVEQWTNQFFGRFVTEKQKKGLREKVMNGSLDLTYPFDAELKFLRTLDLFPGVMLDVGANTGIYSAVLEDLVGSPNLHLFEPLPHLNSYLAQRFKNSQVHDFALSDKDGKQNIRVPIISGKLVDTRATFNDHAEPNQTGVKEIEVKFRTLDGTADRLGLDQVQLMKIDVEGHELEVLAGGKETISKYRPLILMEIETRHHSFPINRVFEKFAEIGYQGFFLNLESFQVLEFSEFDEQRDQNPRYLESRQFIRYLNNFFLVHESQTEDFVEKAGKFLRHEKSLLER